jgi:hypothetical protein
MFLLNTAHFLSQGLYSVRGQLPIILKMLYPESFHLPLVLFQRLLGFGLASRFSLCKPSLQRLLRHSCLFLKLTASLLLSLQPCQFRILLSFLGLLLSSLAVLFSLLLSL